MEDLINKALDMGWRLRSVGPDNCFGMIPPNLSEDVGFTIQTPTNVYLSAPIKDIEEWVKKHTIISPDEKKRDELKAKVVNWLSLEWPGYLKECDDDEDWAKAIIIDDAHSDFGVDKDDIKEWLNARISQL